MFHISLLDGERTGVSPWLCFLAIIGLCVAFRADAQSVRPDLYSSQDEMTPIRSVALTSAGRGIDPSFNTAVTEGNGFVYETAIQPDGKIIAVGLFQRANGVRVNGIARFHPDGMLDASFDSGEGANSNILAVALQPDGKVLIGGLFTSYNGQAVPRIVRLLPSGSIDPSFVSGMAFNNTILDIAVQSNGSIIVGGTFTNFSTKLIRLDSSGDLHTAFQGITGPVYAIAIDPMERILVGSFPSSLSGFPALQRLNSDGTPDASFSPGTGPNRRVSRIVLQPDGRIIASGDFTSYNGVDTDGIVRVNDNGSLDTGFDHIASTNISLETDALALQPDGKIVIGYYYFHSSGEQAHVIRFNADGTIDPDFIQGNCHGGSPYEAKVLPNGKILIGGFLVEYNDETRLRLVQLNPDGSTDQGFAVSTSYTGEVRQIKVLPNDKILIGGRFGFVNGIRTRGGIARLNADGTLDETFQLEPGIYGETYNFFVQPDGRILVGTSYGHIMRLNSDGGLDPLTGTHNSGYSAVVVYAIGMQSNGKIVIAGSVWGPSGLHTSLRLNPDGSFDPTYTPLGLSGSGGTVLSMLIQPDDRIVIGGIFSSGVLFPRAGIARLNADGTLADGFSIGMFTRSLAQQSDGNIVAGGGGAGVVRFVGGNGNLDPSFDIGSGADNLVRAVDVQPDGKIVVGGHFTSFNGNAANRIARLHPNGALDPSFEVGSGTSGTVLAVAAQRDGKVLIGGFFQEFDGREKLSLLRVQDSAAASPAPFDYDGDGKSDISVFRPSDGNWYLQQSTNGFYAVNFGVAADKIVPADYDGDGKTDVAVYRPSTGTWYVVNSSDGTFSSYGFGIEEDLPAPADYDGDGKADITVFRPSTGTWYRQNSSDSSFAAIQFGAEGDRPTIGDFDGDGKADVAVFRPSSGVWYQLNSSDGSFYAEQFGIEIDKIVPADYDGDGKTDIAIYRPAEGLWYVKNSASSTYTPHIFGIAEDIPVPGDYDGDGKADIAVFRPSNGHWYISNSSNSSFTIFQWGQNGDRPTPSAFGN